jgi:hypothetical protein
MYEFAFLAIYSRLLIIMEPDKEQELLQETFNYVRENNKMLKSLRAKARLHIFLKSIYWIVIIIVAIWLYTYFEPFIKSIVPAFKSLGGLEGLSELFNSDTLPNGE